MPQGPRQRTRSIRPLDVPLGGWRGIGIVTVRSAARRDRRPKRRNIQFLSMVASQLEECSKST